MQLHQQLYQAPTRLPQRLHWIAGLGLFISVAASMLASSVANAQTAAPTATPPVVAPQYFSDCAHLLFDNRQRDVLTRQERVLLLDGQVKNNLNNYESCIQQALSASRERASALAPAINQAAATATNEQGASSETTENDQTQTAETSTTTPTQTQPPSASSRQTQQGSRQTGSSSVCDAIKSGLENASTENEKQHFAALAKEYNC